MNKPIINGIDVSECVHLDEWKHCNICKELIKTIPDRHQCVTEQDLRCEYYSNCYYKQLKRLQKENEDLRQVRKNSPDIQEPYVYLYRQIKKQCYRLEEKIKSEKYIKENALQEATKYSMKCGEFRQALKEIRKAIGEKYGMADIIKIRTILDEVLNDRD